MASRIIELRARNFKRLQAVRIRPDGHTVVIGGRNAQGKSSCLDAIWAALGGGRAVPEEPIRRGKSKAEIVLELDGLTITRKFTHAGSKLEVTTTDGDAVRSPQSVLDKLTGSLTFDPLAFCRMAPKEQAETLRQLAGLDTAELDADLAKALANRKEANREVVRLKGVARSSTRHEGVPDTLLVMADLLAVVEERKEEGERISGLRYHEGKITEEIQENLEKIVALQGAVAASTADLHRVQAALEDAEEPDLEGAMDQLANAEQINERIRANIAAGYAESEVNAARDKAEDLDDEVETLRGARQAKIEAATFPVEGLAVEDEGVTFNGIAFEQASGAEKIRVSTAIGLAMNPELRVLLIRDGSLLDADSMAALAKVAEEHDSQIWLERVGDGDEVGVVIEDGEVVEERTGANE